MRNSTGNLDNAFLRQQRVRLETLRNELLRRESSSEDEERSVNEQYGDEPRDTGDEGADLARVEIKTAVHAAGDRRLAQVERALQKMTDGSYGRSDLSGDPIPRERLEAVPEAICTIAEQEQQDARGASAAEPRRTS